MFVLKKVAVQTTILQKRTKLTMSIIEECEKKLWTMTVTNILFIPVCKRDNIFNG